MFARVDNPRAPHPPEMRACIRSAHAARAPIGRHCRAPRRRGLERDSYRVVAGWLRGDRYALIDLTRLMCSRRWCVPVVGGALVTDDGHHLSRIFSTTLGPYLARAVRAALG